MKTKLFYVVIALALVFSLAAAIVPASPAMAATTWYVSTSGNDTTGNGTAGNPWQTIQHAIDDGNVTAGDTINVAAGTYDECVSITKNLTLQGAGDTTIIKPSSKDKLPATIGGVGTGIILVNTNGGTVTVKNLKVDGQSLPTDAITEAERLEEIYFYETGGTIDNVTLVNTNHIAVNNGVHGIMVDAHTNAVTVEIKNSRMSTYRSLGIALGLNLDSTNNVTANVHHNTITGDGPISDHLQNGMEINDNVVANVDYNTVSNVVYAPDGSAAGNCGTGILFWKSTNAGSSADYNIVSNCDVGIANAGRTLTVTNNTLTSNKVGLYAVDYGNPVDLSANYNNIVGSTVYGVQNEDGNANAVDAENNWWGDCSGPSGAGCGTGDAVSANVDYSPWLDATYPGGDSIYFTGDKTESVSNDTLDAKTEADTEVAVTGNATVTAAEYSGNPGAGFSGAMGKYIDVHITGSPSQIEIRLYYTDAEIAGLTESSLRLNWWNGSSWVQCSDSGVNTAAVNSYSGYMWATIRSDTTPNLSQLTGTPFGGGEPAAAGCFIATAAYGTPAAEELDVLRAFRDQVLLESALGSQFVAWYYQASPPLAEFISGNSLLRAFVRELVIDPMVSLAEITQGIWED